MCIFHAYSNLTLFIYFVVKVKMVNKNIVNARSPTIINKPSLSNVFTSRYKLYCHLSPIPMFFNACCGVDRASSCMFVFVNGRMNRRVFKYIISVWSTHLSYFYPDWSIPESVQPECWIQKTPPNLEFLKSFVI